MTVLSHRTARRAFWWSGIACLGSAAAALYLDVSATPVVVLGGIGLLLCLISLAIEIRHKGFTSDAIEHLSACIGLGFGVFGYFFSHLDWAIITAICGFLVCIVVNFGAQIAGQWGDTKDLWRRWREK